MNAIVVVDENWGIGRDGGLLTHLPGDLKYYKSKTLGKVVVIGRKTLESFPGGKPLPNRVNIVLTHKKDYNGKGAIVVHSEEELWEELSKYDTESIFVTGGESIYHMLLPYCDTAYITRLDYEYQADTWMPNLDKEENWSIVEKSEERYCFDLIYHFTTYKNAVPELH